MQRPQLYGNEDCLSKIQSCVSASVRRFADSEQSKSLVVATTATIRTDGDALNSALLVKKIFSTNSVFMFTLSRRVRVCVCIRKESERNKIRFERQVQRTDCVMCTFHII